MRLPLPLAFALALALAATGPAAAQSRLGTTAATFLTLGSGAKATALGHAYSAEAAGAEAVFWNPAGLARDYRGAGGGALFSVSERLVDVQASAAAIAVPVGGGTLGLSLQALDYGRMDVTTVENPDGTGESFGANDLAVGVSYAQPLTESFYVGGTAKYVRQQIYDMTASAVAFDLGVLLQTDYAGGLRLGASISNFGGKMEMRGVNGAITVDLDPDREGNDEEVPADLRADRWDLPVAFRFGASLPVVEFEGARLHLYTDAHQTNDNDLNSDHGLQLSYRTNAVSLDLRGGYRNAFIDSDDGHLSFGAGVDIRSGGLRFGVDYAYVPSQYFDTANVIDLRVHF